MAHKLKSNLTMKIRTITFSFFSLSQQNKKNACASVKFLLCEQKCQLKFA